MFRFPLAIALAWGLWGADKTFAALCGILFLLQEFFLFASKARRDEFSIFHLAGFFLAGFFTFSVIYIYKSFPIGDVDQVCEALAMPIDGLAAYFVCDGFLFAFPFAILLSIAFQSSHLKICKLSKPIAVLSLCLLTLYPVIILCNRAGFDGIQKYANFFFGDKPEPVHSKFLNDHFKFVSADSVHANSTPRNLIFILMESMETSFRSELGAFENLAAKHLSFGPDSAFSLGGGICTPGAQNTIQSTVAKTTGLPLFLQNGKVVCSMQHGRGLFPSIPSIYTILQSKGYRNIFLQGSSGEFASTGKFFLEHGIEAFYDNGPTLANAQTDGWADVFSKSIWHDSFVLQKARDILDTVSDKPFSLTIATIDTHFPAGFYDENCAEKPASLSDKDKLLAAAKCSIREVSEFIDWISEQPFYENTVIVVVGDHVFPGELLSANTDSKLWIDLFIHSAKAAPQKIRNLTSFDIAPTILESMGFSLPDSRMGLGVSLFSGRKTLLEDFGPALNHEFSQMRNSFEYQNLLVGKFSTQP